MKKGIENTIVLILLLLLIGGCGQRPDSPAAAPTTQMVFKAFSEPTITNLTAALEIIGIGQYPMTRQGDDTWGATIPALAPGTYNIRMVYSCQQDKAYQVAGMKTLSVTIRSGETTTIGADAILALLDQTMNEDGDAVTNLGECRTGTQIGNEKSYPEVVVVSADTLSIPVGGTQKVDLKVVDHLDGRPLSGVVASLGLDLVSTVEITGSSTCITGSDGTCSVTIRGRQSGVAKLTATIGKKDEGNTAVSTNITVRELKILTVSPTNPSIAAGNTQSFTATGTFSDGTTKDISTTSTWSSSVPSVATINSGTGVATGVAIGTATITATSGLISGTATLTVTPAELVSLQVTPNTASVAKGRTQQFTATGTFTDGSTQDISSSATWTYSEDLISISSSGLVTADAVGGPITITATSGSISGMATVTVTPPALTTINVTPATTTIIIGQTQPFTATGTFTDHSTQDISDNVTWTSSGSSVAAINNSGLATAVAAGGPVTITATSGSISGTAALTVTSATLVSLEVTPNTASVAKGRTQQFTATGTFSDGSTQVISGSVIWTSLDTQVATINNNGLATGVGVGGPIILTATSGSVSGMASLTVTPPELTTITVTPGTASVAKGLTRQLTATGTFTDYSTQDMSGSVTWTSSNTPVATINNGLASAVAVGGPVTITATSGSISGTATLSVTPPVLTAITLTPNTVSIAKGLIQQFIATGTLSDSSTQDISASATWTSSDASVATISSGFATAVAVGTPVTITATSGSVSGMATLTVTPPALTTIAISPDTVSVAKGLTQPFTATGTFTDDSTQNMSGSVTWTSNDISRVTISPSGLATGVAVGGPVTITATSGTISGMATLTVTPPPLVEIHITPAGSSVAIGQTKQLIATGTFTDGSVDNISSSATWTSSDPSVATVSNTGVVTGVAAGGPITITATLGSISGTVTLSVVAITLTAIDVTPSTASIAIGETKQFTATGTFSDGSTQNISSSATWTSSDPSIATISGSGLATAGANGTTTITAMTGAISGTATLTVKTRSWQTAALIETDNTGRANRPQVAVDSVGNATAVWQQSDGIRDNIWANRFVAGAGGGWGVAVLIETDNAGPATNPQVAVDSVGNAIAVWQQSDGIRNNIWANRFVAGAGGGWGVAVLIETDNAGPATNPQVAVDSVGNAIAVWEQFTEIRSDIWANRFVAGAGGGWGTPTLIEESATGHGYVPQVAVDSAGNAIAVWEQYQYYSSYQSSIWANRFVAATNQWGTATLIGDQKGRDPHSLQVAVDSAGNAIAVWVEYSSPFGGSIYANRFSGGSWGVPTLIEDGEIDNIYSGDFPQVAFDPFGNAIVVWHRFDEMLLFSIYAKRFSGGVWGVRTLIETDNTKDAYSPQVAVDSFGNAVAVWQQDDSSFQSNIWANRFE